MAKGANLLPISESRGSPAGGRKRLRFRPGAYHGHRRHLLLRAARDRSYRVLACRPDETEVGIGFAGLIDLLGDVANEAIHDLPEPQRKALDAALMRGSAEAPVEPGAVAVAVTGILRMLARRG